MDFGIEQNVFIWLGILVTFLIILSNYVFRSVVKKYNKIASSRMNGSLNQSLTLG